MFNFHGRPETSDIGRRRRIAIRRIWPALGSERLIRMFEGLILVAATHPEKLKTFELAITLATKPAPAKAELGNRQRKESTA
jgi:hypothetical protein